MNTSQQQILIISQNKEFAALLASCCDSQGLLFQVCSRKDQALRFLERNYATIVIIDEDAADCSGMDILQALRTVRLKMPVIMLMGQEATETDVIEAFSCGADDALRQPVSALELMARIQSILKRMEYNTGTNNPSILEAISAEPFSFSGATVYPQRMEMEFADGKREKIGRKELGILTHLVANPSIVLTRRSMIFSVWGPNADVRSRSLDQYIVRLRDMFERHGCEMAAFRTIHGVGYIYDPQLSVVKA